MASNNRKTPPRWPPKNADDRNRHVASKAQAGGSLHAKRRIDNKKVQDTLDDMFINIFDSEIIRSVAHSCGWKLNKSIEALIMLAEGSEFPDSKFDSCSFQTQTLSEGRKNEKPWVSSKSKPVKDTSKNDKSLLKESCREGLFTSSSSNTSAHSTKKQSLVMKASQGTIKVTYKGSDELSDDDDADVVIEEENEFEVSELDPAFSGASSQSLYQFLTPFVSPGQSYNDNKQNSFENTVRENNPSCAYNAVAAKPKQRVDLVHDSLDKSPPKVPVKKTKHWPKFEKIKKNINDGVKIMIFMRGCPGSGKTSLARHIIRSTYGENEQKFIFSADNYFTLVGNGKYSFDPRLLPYAHQWNQQQVREEVKKGTNPIIIDNTNLEAWEMEPYVRMAVQFGYNVEFLEPRTSWRDNSLELERKNTHGVPQRRIEDMLARFERDLTPTRLLSLFNLRYSVHNTPPQYVSKRKSAAPKEDGVLPRDKKEMKDNISDDGRNVIKTALPSQIDVLKPLQLSEVLSSDIAEKEIKDSLHVSEWNYSIMTQSKEKVNNIVSEAKICNLEDDTETIQGVSVENCVSRIDKNLCESPETMVKTGINQPHDQDSNNFRFIDPQAGGDDEIDFVAESTDMSEEEEELVEMKFENAFFKLDNNSEDNGNQLSKSTAVHDHYNKTEDSRDFDVKKKCMDYVMVLSDGTLLPQKSYIKENNSARQPKVGERQWEYFLMTEDSKLLFHPTTNYSSEKCVGDSKALNISDSGEPIHTSQDILDLDGNVAISFEDNPGAQITREEVSSLDYLHLEDKKIENVKGDNSAKIEESEGIESKTNLETKFSDMDLLEAEGIALMNIAFTGIGDSPSKDSLCLPEVEISSEDIIAVQVMSPPSSALEKGITKLYTATDGKAAVNHSSNEQANVLLNFHNSFTSGGEASDDVKFEVIEDHENSLLLEKVSSEEVSVTLQKIESISPKINEEAHTDLISFISLCQEKQSVLTKEMQVCSNLSISSENDTRENDILETWEEGKSWNEQEKNTILIPKIIDSSTPKPARNMRRQIGTESSSKKGEEKENKIKICDANNSVQWSAVEEPIATWEEKNGSMVGEQEKLSERVGPQPQRKIFAKEEEGEEKANVEELSTSSSSIKLGSKEDLIFLQPVSLSDVLLSDELECTNENFTDAVDSLAINVSVSVTDTEATEKRHGDPAASDINVEPISDSAGCSYNIDSSLDPKKNILHSSTNTHHEDFITLGNVNTRSLNAAPGVKILPALSRDIIDSDTLIESKREVKKIRPILMLDKSSMTYDIVSSPPETENVKEQLQELVKMFPNCSLQDLLEIFNKCNKDINWTVDLLLESASRGIEISTPNSRHGNEPDGGILVEINSPMQNSEIVENASSTDNGNSSNVYPIGETLTTPCNSSRISPVSIETCAKSTLPNKRSGKKDRATASETSLLLKKQLEENIVINEEHYSEHVSRIRKLRHGEMVEDIGSSHEGDESFGVYLPQENLRDIISEEFLLEQRIDTGAASAYTLRPNAPEWSDCESNTQAVFEEHEEEETVFVKIDAAFAEQLHIMFGTATSPFNQDKEPIMNIPLSLARQLHSYVMEAEQNTYDQMMQEDEELARKLQVQDDKEIAEATTTTGNHVPDLREIMDMEMALAMYKAKADQKQSRNETKEDLATKLTKNLLFEWFPSVPKDILMNVFEAHNNSFDETLEILLASTEEDSSVRNVMTSEARAAHEKALLNKANLESRKNKENAQRYSEESEKVTSEEAMGDAKYYRSEASRHCCLRNECQSKAQKAYQRGHTAVASYYSQMAMLHKERIEENNAKAASSLLLAHSLGNLNTTLDLHFLYVVEALQVLDMFLDHHIQNLVESNHRSVPVFVITGRGLRSSGGRSRIKPAVVQRLEQRGLRHEEVNPGLLKVFVTKNSATSAKMMTC